MRDRKVLSRGVDGVVVMLVRSGRAVGARADASRVRRRRQLNARRGLALAERVVGGRATNDVFFGVCAGGRRRRD